MAKFTSQQQAIISAKMRKVHKDHPEKDSKQMAGMAFGILRQEGKIPGKKTALTKGYKK